MNKSRIRHVEVAMRTISGYLVGLGLAVVALGLSAVAHATPSPRAFRSPPHQIVSIEPPAGWDLSASPPSTRLVASWTHRDGAKLTLVAERAAADVEAGKLFEQSRPSLERQGWTLGAVNRQPTRVLVEATLDRGKRSARQLYLVEGGFVYVLTLVAPVEQTSARARDLDETIASLRTSTSEAPRP